MQRSSQPGATSLYRPTFLRPDYNRQRQSRRFLWKIASSIFILLGVKTLTDRSDIIEVLARYVRAADHRNPEAMADVFLPDATVEIFYSDRGALTKLGELSGAEVIGNAVRDMMAPHPRHGWSHHTTLDHIVTVDGDEATIDAQFIVYNTVGLERPANGWPAGASSAQGTITPIESGYYRPRLRRVSGSWRIARHVIVHDLPMAFPGT
jgi:hypothetical protein